MAKRRRRGKIRTRVIRAAKTVRRRAKKFSSKPEAVIVPAMLYGALREKASMALDPLLSRIPMGSIADEVGMGIASYLVAKKGKGMIKKVGLAGLTIESARLGEAVASGGFSGLIGGQSTAANENILG